MPDSLYTFFAKVLGFVFGAWSFVAVSLGIGEDTASGMFVSVPNVPPSEVTKTIDYREDNMAQEIQEASLFGLPNLWDFILKIFSGDMSLQEDKDDLNNEGVISETEEHDVLSNGFHLDKEKEVVKKEVVKNERGTQDIEKKDDEVVDTESALPLFLEKEKQKVPPPKPFDVVGLQEDKETDNNVFTTLSLTPKDLNVKVRAATVNIFCLTKTGGFFEPISGSGAIIDERGVILTNAHVAQYFLLKDYREPNFIDCVIRTGSPARLEYRAVPIYISEEWVRQNSEALVRSNPKGSGEYDYALLYINKSARNGVSLPSVFPTLSPRLERGDIEIGSPVFVGGYPAGFLDGIGTQRELWLTTTISSIVDLYTFGDVPTTDVDLFEIKGTINSQAGASGGPSVGFSKGELLGIIVTRTQGDNTSERNLRVLSTPYIDREMRVRTGSGLDEFLEGDLKEKADDFASTTALRLTDLLVGVLER